MEVQTCELLRLAWAVAVLGLQTPEDEREPAGFDIASSGVVREGAGRRGPRVAGHCAGARGRGLLSELGAELARRRLGPARVATALWSLSRLGGSPAARRAFHLLSQRLMAEPGGGGAAQLGPAAVVKLATACAQAAWAPSALLSALAARGAALAPRLPAPLLAQLVWALAAARVAHRGLLEASARRAAELATAFADESAAGPTTASSSGGGCDGSDSSDSSRSDGSDGSCGSNEGFTSSRQPEALLLGWSQLGFCPPPALSLRLEAVASELRRREGRAVARATPPPPPAGGAGGAAAGGAPAAAASGGVEAAAAGSLGGAGAGAGASRPRASVAGAGGLADRLAIATARGRLVRPAHPSQRQQLEPPQQQQQQQPPQQQQLQQYQQQQQ
ncbi:hypothetical protein MNEG_14801 [Monoraphidium neglectum]|uniref:RAP domain-containing protein n=1 Tax=Monoraphidium neglectum TaxID=145388 RepID=A0A0D2IZB3_9CHLO|nr:hypothetical protein MNEG_14801 [Monoraphidium neglectum]KIY93162.1 hypothetical protein MNEG_14801 [Monoraphidium neglectum]|eukprot:XP_013892182.1 hypothetical protein MNEG_14801 [Monoraphidium neglectum]